MKYTAPPQRRSRANASLAVEKETATLWHITHGEDRLDQRHNQPERGALRTASLRRRVHRRLAPPWHQRPHDESRSNG
jgi:hypothetical protein